MKSLIPFLIITGLMIGCGQRETSVSHVNADTTAHDSILSLQFPIVIEGGKKIVYQSAQMTPRGLKYFLDTVDNIVVHPGMDSVKTPYLLPTSLSPYEKDAAPGFILITLPGMREQTVFAVIDDIGRLRINYKGEEIYTLPNRDIVFKGDFWTCSFRKGAIEVRIAVELNDTKIGNQLAGKGNITVLENGALTAEAEMFLVYNNRSYVITDLIGR